jgi:PAS domain S-box-containing protein
MQMAPLRENEQASLDALLDLEVLDTAPEAEFDALVRAASLVCHTPISLICLVDADRQWFKANVGLPGVTETPRSLAFCAHAVRQDEIFEIPDASLDGRFADNPLVTGPPGILFYAGAPISLATGERVGTLCVIDRLPQQLDIHQREVLVLLAAAAAKALEGRRALRLLEEASATNRRMTAMIESERMLLRKLLETIPDLVWLKNAAGVYLVCNPALEPLYGAPAADIVGKTDADFLSAALADDCRRKDLEAVAAGRPTVSEEWETFANDGHRALLETTKTPMLDGQGRLVGILGIARDITEQRRYRDQLEEIVAERTAALRQAYAEAEAVRRESQETLAAESESRMQSRKLVAVGTLAAGIAHDFNNILASIVAYAELADDELVDGSEAKRNVGDVISGCFRARDLVARMLDFARARTGDFVFVNIVFQVREALALLRASLPPSIELAFESRITNATAIILADPTQIMQIVMNLCINSSHAMDHHGVIKICIEPAAGIKDAPTDQLSGICITVADTGCGIAPELMERIFDPFFTTRAPGEGSGLGLSVVYGIAKSLDGDVKVRSSTVLGSCGTQLQVFLPAIRPPPIESTIP